MNVKLQKTLARLCTGAIGTLLIGTVIKLEKKADDKIGEHFDKKAE